MPLLFTMNNHCNSCWYLKIWIVFGSNSWLISSVRKDQSSLHSCHVFLILIFCKLPDLNHVQPPDVKTIFSPWSSTQLSQAMKCPLISDPFQIKGQFPFVDGQTVIIRNMERKYIKDLSEKVIPVPMHLGHHLCLPYWTLRIMNLATGLPWCCVKDLEDAM